MFLFHINIYRCNLKAAGLNPNSNRLNSSSTIVRRAKVFADQFRKNPDWLFTTPQQKFDFLYTGRFAYGSVIHNILLLCFFYLMLHIGSVFFFNN